MIKHADSGADRSLAGGGDLKPAGTGSQNFSGGGGGGALDRADVISLKTPVPPASAPKETPPPAKSKATDYGR